MSNNVFKNIIKCTIVDDNSQHVNHFGHAYCSEEILGDSIIKRIKPHKFILLYTLGYKES